METIWGTVPDWIAAGTAAAFLWAVFLYRQNLRDREIGTEQVRGTQRMLSAPHDND